ncbi:hypothetical protein [Pseudomonas fluorescens]|uniref:hypothetical protein n=1 Tax=Pseudomonas fluorescens TaxID=294 RepID=UPI0016567D78|nr:hypothetical protein [Pseudomonas fluorescens]MBC8786361.1 hypothetical protein [Pseudomonas fluorescens]
MNIPKGFKLVPVKPTQEMLDAAFGKVGGEFYKAALASAPTPPQPIYDEAKERELFNEWYGELPTTKFKETMWMAWEACAQSSAKDGEGE